MNAHMTHRIARRTLPLLVFALSQSLATATRAQIEEVVVTAQKKEESLQDAPLAVTAFTADRLEDIGAFDATDIAEYTPNVSIVPIMGSTANIRMEIRGMSTAEPSLTVDPKVGIYLDGAYLARNSGAVFDIVDLERVEVMRGPQGTLWGKNTTGGAVNLITAKPNGEFGFKQQGSFGNDGYIRSITTIDTNQMGPVAGKFTYMYKNYDGWAENHGPSEEDLASEEVNAFRVALAWDVTDDLTVDYSYDYTDADSVAPPLQPVAVSELGAQAGGTYDIEAAQYIPYNALAQMAQDVTDDRRDDFFLDNMGEESVEISGHNLTVTWDLPLFTIKSISSYRDYESDFPMNDLDGGAWAFEGESLPVFHTAGEKEQDQFQQELQFLGTAFDDSVDYVLGLYYFEEDGEDVNPWDATVWSPSQTTQALLRGITLGSYYGIDNKSKAIFGQATWRPTPEYYITVGARYSEDEKELILLQEDPRLDQDYGFDEDWSKFTPAITLGFQPSDDLNLYFKYAEGYNAGVYAIPPQPQNLTDGWDPADEEELTSYELGLKSMWFDNTLRLNAALFYNDADNLQITWFVDGNRTIINSGSSETEGLEIEATWMPNQSWAVDASFGYRDTERDTVANLADPDDVYSGSFGVSYFAPLGDWAQLHARFDSSYKDAIQYSSSGYANTEDRWLLNARLALSEITLADGMLRAALWGRNLADEEYGVHGQDLGVSSGYGYAVMVYGQPRSYGVDLIWEF